MKTFPALALLLSTSCLALRVEAPTRPAGETLRKEDAAGRETVGSASVEPRAKADASGARPESVKPGINESFLSPELDVDRFIERFEAETREVYRERESILAALALQPGERVADIGAGTGAFTRLFARAVGEEGWVYAVDISPRFLEHLRRVAKAERWKNVTDILCAQDSVDLPPASIDLAFVCDTYHHFEYPHPTLRSIRRALRPGGRLVVIDFERIPGKTRQWLLDHVRSGKATFRREIEAAGFEFEEEVDLPGLEENYYLRFRRPTR